MNNPAEHQVQDRITELEHWLAAISVERDGCYHLSDQILAVAAAAMGVGA